MKRKKKKKGGSIKKIIYTLPLILVKVMIYPLVQIGRFIKWFFGAIATAIGPMMGFIKRFIISLHVKLGFLFPSRIRKGLHNIFIYSGVTQNPEETLGVTLLYSFVFPIVAGMVTYIFMDFSIEMVVLSSILVFFAVWVLMYLILLVMIDRRTKNIENVLPDLLSLISQNMRAGMTPYNALWAASRPEFGPLALEIQTVAQDTLTGVSLEDALLNVTKRVNSTKLDRCIRLMVQGMRSGGELPAVLQEISDGIRSERNLRNRMEAETTSQVLFIAFALVIGAPMLFAASHQFITMFHTTFSAVGISESTQSQTGSLIHIEKFAISPEFFFQYAVYVLIISSFLGSLIINIMKTGETISPSGIVLIPLIVALSIAVFWGLDYVLGSLFKSMISTL